jgi:hypothetical protein
MQYTQLLQLNEITIDIIYNRKRSAKQSELGFWIDMS